MYVPTFDNEFPNFVFPAFLFLSVLLVQRLARSLSAIGESVFSLG